MTGTVAFVGAAGGVGTTRTTLGCAELLARNGHDTAVLDAAYGTQGLADRISGPIDPDMTRVCSADRPIGDGLVDQPIEGGGRLAVCPARAPFCRLSEAKHPEAAERFRDRIEEAGRQFEHVLIDTPPVAANQAIAAATTADTVAIVSDHDRATAAVPRMADRLADIGVETFLTVVTRTTAHPDADATVPTLETKSPVIGDEVVSHDAFRGVVETTTGVVLEREPTNDLLSGLPFK